jgi:hypothetical protein
MVMPDRDTIQHVNLRNEPLKSGVTAHLARGDDRESALGGAWPREEEGQWHCPLSPSKLDAKGENKANIDIGKTAKMQNETVRL